MQIEISKIKEGVLLEIYYYKKYPLGRDHDWEFLYLSNFMTMTEIILC